MGVWLAEDCAIKSCSVGPRDPGPPKSSAAEKKGSLGRGRSGTSAQSFVLCFSVFWGDFLLQISQKFLSEIAPSNAGIFWKTPSRKTPKRSCWKVIKKSDKSRKCVASTPICDKASHPSFPHIQSTPSQWARRDRLMSWGKNCRETIFVSHLSRNYPHRGVKSPLLWGRDSLGGILGDNLGEGNCESKIASRQWETIFAAGRRSVSQGPLG